MGLISSVFLPLAIAFIMFSLGLGLRIQDFSRIFYQIKDISIGLLSQLIILPLVAFLIAILYPNISPEIAVGLIIISLVPGGATSNMFTSLVRGDVALSISLTALTSLICIFTIPFFSVFAFNYFMSEEIEINILQKSLELFAIVTIPTLLGMSVNNYFNSFSEKIKKSASIISSLLLAIVILGAVLKYSSDLTNYFQQAGIITLILNIIMMTIGFYLGRLFASSSKQTKTFVYELGLQNGTIAIFVAETFFGAGSFIIPAATYSLIMFVTGIISIYFLRKI